MTSPVRTYALYKLPSRWSLMLLPRRLFVLGQNCSYFSSNGCVSFQQDSSIFEEKSPNQPLETSAALSSGLETSVMFPRSILSIPLSSSRLHFDLAKFGITAPEATRNSQRFSSGKSQATPIGNAVTAAPLS